MFFIHTIDNILKTMKVKQSMYVTKEGVQYLKSFLESKPEFDVQVAKTNFVSIDGSEVYELTESNNFYNFKLEFTKFLASLRKRKSIVGNFIKDIGLFINHLKDPVKFQRNYWLLDIEVYSTQESMKKGWNKPQQALMPITSITWYNVEENTYYSIINAEYIKCTPQDLVQLKKQYKNEFGKDVTFVYSVNEEDLLRKFVLYVQIQKPSIISGWFSNQYDIPYLSKRLISYGIFEEFIPFEELKDYGNMMKPYFKEYASGKTGVVYYINIPMVYFIDYRDLYEKFIHEKPSSWSLDNIAKINGIDSKTEKMGYIHIEDLERFAKYAVRDVEILVELEEKLKLISLLNSFNEIIPINLDKLVSALYSVEGYLNLFAFRRNVLLPFTSNSKDISDEDEDSSYAGAYVHTPDDKLHKHVVVLDFASLYPNIMRTFNIDIKPLQHSQITSNMKYCKITKEITGTRDVYFSLEKNSVIKEMVDEILEKRFMYKKLAKQYPDNLEYYNLQLNYKILANSIYGVFGTKYFTFYNVDVALSITSIGRYLIKSVINFVDGKTWDTNINGIQYRFMTKVVYGDTDSVFIQIFMISPLSDDKDVISTVADYVRNEINTKLFDFVKPLFFNMSDDEIKQRMTLTMEVDKMFRVVKFFGVKKRYYGLSYEDEEIYKGVDIARSDFPKVLRDKLNESYRLFVSTDLTSEQMSEHIRSVYTLLKQSSVTDIAEAKTVTSTSEQYKVEPYHLRGWNLFKYIMYDKFDITLTDDDVLGQKIFVLPIIIPTTSKYFDVARDIFNEKRKKIHEIKGYLSFREQDVQYVNSILSETNITVDYYSLYEQFVKRFESFLSESAIQKILNDMVTTQNTTALFTLFSSVI